MSEPLPETVVEERDRLRAERNRAESALTDQGRAVVDSTGDLEDGINFDLLAKNAEIGGLVDALTAVRAERDQLRADMVRHTEYQCPACFCWAPWTDGRSVRSGDEVDEFWCQVCGTECPLTACPQRLVVDGLRHERDQARADLERARDAAKTFGEIATFLGGVIHEAWRQGPKDPFGALHILGNHIAEALPADDDDGDEFNRTYEALEQRRCALADLRKLVEEALHLRMHGERAPGGTETWREWDLKAPLVLRALDGETGGQS